SCIIHLFFCIVFSLFLPFFIFILFFFTHPVPPEIYTLSLHDALPISAASISDRIGGGPPPGFGGMLEGDPAAEARAQLSEDEAERCWQEGRSLELEQALAMARAGAQN